MTKLGTIHTLAFYEPLLCNPLTLSYCTIRPYCSNDWNRSCCKPYHPLKLEVRQYIPAGFGGVSNTTEHVWTDVQTSAQDMRLMRSKARQQQQQQLRDRERYKSYPVLMTAQRIDGQRCVACPCKWLNTFVCFDFCQDGMHLYAGAIEEEGSGGNDLGRPPTDPPSWVGHSAHLRRLLLTDHSFVHT